MGNAPRYWVPFLTLVAWGAEAQVQPAVSIRIVQGDNAINSIRMHRGHDPAVQVLSQSGEPLPHATVSFLLPATGASGHFGDSGLSVTVETDARGMAVGRGLIPNAVEGPFQIRVTASSRGEAANATIRQTNAEPAVKSARTKWIVIAAVVAGGAVGGIAAAHGGKSSETAGATTGSTATGAVITPGTPAFGPPH